MEGAWDIASVLFQVWLSIVVGLIMLPAMFGVSLGFTDLYIKVLVKTLEVNALKQIFFLKLVLLYISDIIHITCSFWKNRKFFHLS